MASADVPPTSTMLTLVLTTSPTPSAPSTELLEAILTSFRQCCPALLGCRVILVLDTYDRVGAEPRLKKGRVNEEGAKVFNQYKENAKQLVLKNFLAGTPLEADNLISSQSEAE
jgi:hypothetical protein